MRPCLLHSIEAAWSWLVSRWSISLDLSNSQDLAWVIWGEELWVHNCIMTQGLEYPPHTWISLRNQTPGSWCYLSTSHLSETSQSSVQTPGTWMRFIPGLRSSEAGSHPQSHRRAVGTLNEPPHHNRVSSQAWHPLSSPDSGFSSSPQHRQLERERSNESREQ